MDEDYESNLTVAVKLHLHEDEDKDGPKLLIGSSDHDHENQNLVLRPSHEPQVQIQFNKLARPFCLLGFMCLCLGLTIVAVGIASFIVIPTFETRNSFQVESKWTNLLLIVAGLCAIATTLSKRLTLVCGTLIFSLVSASFAFFTVALHVTNYYFRTLDTEYYEEFDNITAKQHSISVGSIYLTCACVSAVACFLSLFQFMLLLHIIGKSYGFKVHLAMHSLRLTLMGLVEVIAGLLITGLWVAIKTFFIGEGADFHELPNSEVLSHGLFILCAGAMQMIAMGKGTTPLLVSATVMQGVVYVVTTFYGDRPLSVLAFSLDQSRSTMGGHAVFESRMAVAVMLGASYVLTMLLSIYCFAKFLHMLAENHVPQLDCVLQVTRRRLRILSYVQCGFALLYSIVDVVAIGLLVLYKLDFTPLPLFILTQGIFIYFAMHNRSSLLLSVSVVAGIFCSVYSLRDIYLFVYHVTVNATPDGKAVLEGSAGKPMTAANLSVHLFLVTVALAEIVISIWLVVIACRVLSSCVSVYYNRVEVALTVHCTRIIALLQMFMSLSMIVAGTVLFLGRSYFVESFGDLTIAKSLIIFTAALLTLLHEKRPSLLPSALFMQVFVFTLILLQADLLAYYLHNHLELPTAEQSKMSLKDSEHLIGSPLIRIQDKFSINLGYANFAMFIFEFIFAGIGSLLLGRLLEASRFNVREGSNFHEEMVTLKAANFKSEI